MKSKIIYVVGIVIVALIIFVVLTLNKTCMVIFNTVGGTIYPTEQVKCGNPVKKPKDPVLDGYTFVKWVDSKTKKEFDFTKPIDEDTTIDVEWQVKTVTD